MRPSRNNGGGYRETLGSSSGPQYETPPHSLGALIAEGFKQRPAGDIGGLHAELRTERLERIAGDQCR
ncbi:hypothetical protein [Mycolicibacterium sp. HS_4_1]